MPLVYDLHLFPVAAHGPGQMPVEAASERESGGEADLTKKAGRAMDHAMAR